MKSKVSVIMPCFNVEACVAEGINSVLKQTYDFLELILIDNASTDETWPILNSYASRYPNVFCYQEFKPGAPAARNKGVKKASGDWLQFLDADDLLLPQKIEHQLSLLEEEGKVVAFVAGACQRFFLNGNSSFEVPEKDPWLGIMKGQFGHTSSNLWNKGFIEEVGGWEESQESSQEYELMFRLLKLKPLVLIDTKVFTSIRERTNSISSSNIRENQRRATVLRVKIYDYVEEAQIAGATTNFLPILLQFVIKFGQFDYRTAEGIFNIYFPKDYVIDHPEIGNIYSFLFNIFGFKWTQRIYYIYKKILG